MAGSARCVLRDSRVAASSEPAPAQERVKKCRITSFRGAGPAREPGTYEHRTGIQEKVRVHGFRACPCRASRNDNRLTGEFGPLRQFLHTLFRRRDEEEKRGTICLVHKSRIPKALVGRPGSHIYQDKQGWRRENLRGWIVISRLPDKVCRNGHYATLKATGQTALTIRPRFGKTDYGLSFGLRASATY